MTIIETKRLILREWRPSDVDALAAINQDPKVMEYFPGLQDLETTKNFITKVNNHFNKYGYSLYAAIRKDGNEFIGFIGLLIADFKAHFTPATEIGWRLSSKHWGQGFATEGAQAVLDYAFRELKIPEIVSFTAQGNAKSIKVMQKIGLQHDSKDDFDHPKLDDTNPLKRHVLYCLNKQNYYTLIRNRMVAFSKSECQQNLNNEKYLSEVREYLITKDSSFQDINKKFDWCGAYVHYILKQSGINLPVKYKSSHFGFVKTWVEWAKDYDYLITNKNTPIPGDLIVFDKLLSEHNMDHIGIVIDQDRDEIICSEGNIETQPQLIRRSINSNINCFIRIGGLNN